MSPFGDWVALQPRREANSSSSGLHPPSVTRWTIQAPTAFSASVKSASHFSDSFIDFKR
jgi:hypothetical protein